MFPALDLNDPGIDVHLQNGVLPPIPMRAPRVPQPLQDMRLPLRPDQPPFEESNDSHLESMVKATGQLDLDEDGNWDYHGHSSGLSFMRRLQQQFGDIMPPVSSDSSPFPTGTSPYLKYRPLSQVFDSPVSAHPSPVRRESAQSLESDLPSKADAKALCETALEAGALMRVVHMPSFYNSLDRIYELSPENYGNAENVFLPLLYATLALGTLFSKDDGTLDPAGYEKCIEDG